MNSMVENIDSELWRIAPERLLIAQTRRNNHELLWENGLDNPRVSEALWYAHHIGKWAEFLALVTDERVKQILDLLKKPQENVTALCDGLLDGIRRQHGDRLARIVGWFLWHHGEPHQFVSPATAALMESAFTMPPEEGNKILTELGWRAFVMS